VMLVDAISQAPQYGWGSVRTIAVVAAGCALLVGFVVIERRSEAPILPLGIFRLRTLTGAITAGLLVGGSFFAFLFIGTLYMQHVLHSARCRPAGPGCRARSRRSCVLASRSGWSRAAALGSRS
jgi:hypothetical protein